MSGYDPKRTFARNHPVSPSGAPSEREMTIGQGLAWPNQPDKGRITTCQAGLVPDLFWGARSVTVVGNRGEPSGESRGIRLSTGGA